MYKTLFITLIALTFISCSKSPFTAQEVKQNSALVYVYAIASDDNAGAGDNAQNDSKFNILINGKFTQSGIGENEYAKYELKVIPVDVSAIRNEVDARTIHLDLEAGKTYYLKLQSYSDNLNGYNFLLMSEEEGLAEIKNTVNSNKYKSSGSLAESLLLINKDKNTTPLIDEKAAIPVKNVPVQKLEKIKVSSNSKLDNIKEAYEMKKQGLLTNEEFKEMKAEILAK